MLGYTTEWINIKFILIEYQLFSSGIICKIRLTLFGIATEEKCSVKHTTNINAIMKLIIIGSPNCSNKWPIIKMNLPNFLLQSQIPNLLLLYLCICIDHMYEYI